MMIGGMAHGQEVVDDWPEIGWGWGWSRGLPTVAAPEAIGGDYRTMSNRKESTSFRATWSASLVKGVYEVFIHLPDSPARQLAQRTHTAQYEISHALGAAVMTVDQQARTGWVRLGSWSFDAGATTITLRDVTGEPDGTKTVVVDAVKWIRTDQGARTYRNQFSIGSAPGYPTARAGDSSYEYLAVWGRQGEADWVSSNFRWTIGSRIQLWLAAVLAYPQQPDWAYVQPEQIDAWVDWNGDRQWTENERVANATLETGERLGDWRNSAEEGTTYSATLRDLIVPTDAAVGQTWMRVRLTYGAGPGAPDRSAEYGEVMDLKVTIVPMREDAKTALLVTPLLSQGAGARGLAIEPLQAALAQMGYAIDSLVDNGAEITRLVSALERRSYRFIYFGTESLPADGGALVLESYATEAAAKSRLSQLQVDGFETEGANPEIILRPLPSSDPNATRWTLAITPWFIRRHVGRLWDALVLIDGSAALRPEALPFVTALIDRGAFLVAGWKRPVDELASVIVMAELMSHLGAGASWATGLHEINPLPLPTFEMPGEGVETTIADVFGFLPVDHGEFQLTLGAVAR
jgi:hypothetical protein